MINDNLMIHGKSQYPIMPSIKMTCESIREIMQAKQVHEIASMAEVNAEFSNLTLVQAKRDEKIVWNFQFDYLTTSGIESAMLVSQHNKPRFWVSLDTATREIRNLFPNVKNIALDFNS